MVKGKIFRSLLALGLTGALSLSAFAASVSAATRTESGYIEMYVSDSYKMQDHLDAVRAISNALYSHSSRIDVSSFKIPQADMSGLYFGTLASHPDLFFVDRNYSWNNMGGYVYQIYPSYNMTQSEAQTALESFYSEADHYLALASGKLSRCGDDFSRAVTLHDEIVLDAFYDNIDYESDNYRFMMQKTGVCENYSRVYAKSRAYNTAAGYQSEIIKYYEGKKNSSGNKWYDIRILKAMFTKIELAHLAGDEKKAEQLISKDLESFLRINGYDASCLKKKISGSDAELMGDLFNDIANFYIHNERKYKIAIKYYELSLHFRTKKEAVSVKKKSIVGTTDKVIFQKFPPEEYETDKAKLDSYARMYMCYAASVFMNGDKNKSFRSACFF